MEEITINSLCREPTRLGLSRIVRFNKSLHTKPTRKTTKRLKMKQKYQVKWSTNMLPTIHSQFILGDQALEISRTMLDNKITKEVSV